MIHAREDWNKPGALDATIPQTEPVFLIRGQDRIGARVVRFWAEIAEGIGVHPSMVRAAREHADKMEAWPKKKVPDMPGAPATPMRLTDSTVNHPAHYGGDTTYEAIKVIEAWGLGFCLGNAVKYICRAGKKGSTLEDLEKARWYLDREIETLKKKELEDIPF